MQQQLSGELMNVPPHLFRPHNPPGNMTVNYVEVCPTYLHGERLRCNMSTIQILFALDHAFFLFIRK
jgi:hypothetical protein